MRRCASTRTSTSPASLSTRRCLETCGWRRRRRRTRYPTGRGPSRKNSTMCSRLGSASALRVAIMPEVNMPQDVYSCQDIFFKRNIHCWSCRAANDFPSNGVELRQLGGEVGHHEIGGVNFVDKLAVGFRFVAHGLPFGIVAEGLPIGGGGFAAGMRQDIHEGLALEGFVGGRPVRDVFYSVLFEEFGGVL